MDPPAVPANDPVLPAAERSTGCATCVNRTPHKNCAEPVQAGLADYWHIVWLPEDGGLNCPAHRACEQRQPHEALPRLTPEQVRAVIGWDDVEIAQASRYMRQADRHGFDNDMAERITDNLMLRDGQNDDRILCVECQHLAGRPSTGWRCRSDRVAGVSSELPGDMVAMLQRCPGFKAATT